MFKDKKRLEVEEEKEENIYNNFMSEEVNEPEESTIEENKEYEYKEKEYKGNSLEENTKVTTASKASRGLLFGFYLLLIVLGFGAFLMIRSNKYEFYLKQDKVLIDEGSSYQVELIPKDVRYFDYTNYKYSIDNEKIASVDEFGTITAVGKGETTLKISLKLGLGSKSMKIVTEDIDVENVELLVFKGDKYQSSNKVSMKTNQSTTIKPVVNNRDDLNVTGIYSSSNDDVATVDEFGNITAKKEGTAIINADVNGVVGSITVEVKKGESTPTNPTPKPTNTSKPVNPTTKPTTKPTVTPQVIKNIYMSTSSISVKKGSTVQLTAIITPKELSKATLTWTSSNTKVATVNKNGLVTGVSTGKATISAKTSNGLVAKCEVTITNDNVVATGIALNKTSLSIDINETYQLVATLKPANTTVRKLIWTSSNEKVATVDQNGLVTGITNGEATIMVTSSDGKAIAKSIVTVKKAATPTPKPSTTKVTSVSLGIANQTSKYVGDQLQLSAVVTPSSVTNYAVKWSSNDNSVATVSNSGLVKCVGSGTVTITAEVNGVKGTATIVVRPKSTSTNQTPPAGTAFKPTQIKLSQTTLTVNKGKTATFTITLTKAAGTVKVTSSNTSVLKLSLPKGDDDMPICSQTTNICFLDGFSNSDQITITATGVSAGTAYINVAIDDIETSSGEVLTGTGKIGVLVK